MSTFGPEWIVLPDGSGLHRGDLGPCGQCGESVFVLVNRNGRLLVACPQCCKSKPGDRITGRVDMTDGSIRGGRHG